MSKKIKYEAHPVSMKRKQELLSQGYVILDVKFAPEKQTTEKPVANKATKPTRAAKPTKAVKDEEF